LLKELLEKNRVEFYDSFDNWQDAIRSCCHSLIADGSITEKYAEAIIDNVLEYGPYIVITDDLAIPHTKVNAQGVRSNGISFTKVAKPVEFEPGNPKKSARLIFTLAANDMDGHYDNMERLSEMLLNEEALRGLQEADDLASVKLLSKRLGI